MDGNVAEKCNRLLGQLWLPSFEVKSIKMGQRRRQRRRSYPDQDVSFPPKKKLAKLRRCVSHVHFAKIKVVKISAFGKNIATGETSPAITPHHFFGNFNFFNFHR